MSSVNPHLIEDFPQGFPSLPRQKFPTFWALCKAQVTKLAVSFDSADRKKLERSFGMSCEGASRGQEGTGMGIAILNHAYTCDTSFMGTIYICMIYTGMYDVYIYIHTHVIHNVCIHALFTSIHIYIYISTY